MVHLSKKDKEIRIYMFVYFCKKKHKNNKWEINEIGDLHGVS